MARTAVVFAALAILMVMVLALVSLPIFEVLGPKTQPFLYGPGPISTFPASWDNPCGFPVQGNRTTANSVVNSQTPAAENLNLSQVYSKIVDSPVFQTLAAGRSWRTIQWAISQEGNRTGSYNEVSGDFIFISAGRPDGHAQVGYILETGEVVIDYTGPLISAGCPPINNETPVTG